MVIRLSHEQKHFLNTVLDSEILTLMTDTVFYNFTIGLDKDVLYDKKRYWAKETVVRIIKETLQYGTYLSSQKPMFNVLRIYWVKYLSGNLELSK